MYNYEKDKKINSFAPLGTAGDFGRTNNGGKGSGNFGHAGREGKVGGSAPSGSGGNSTSKKIRVHSGSGEMDYYYAEDGDRVLASGKTEEEALEKAQKKLEEESKPKDIKGGTKAEHEAIMEKVKDYIVDEDGTIEEVFGNVEAAADPHYDHTNFQKAKRWLEAGGGEVSYYDAFQTLKDLYGDNFKPEVYLTKGGSEENGDWKYKDGEPYVWRTYIYKFAKAISDEMDKAEHNSVGSFYEELDKRLNELAKALNGGKGSGNFGHAGRPGEVGGSSPRGYAYDYVDQKKSRFHEGDAYGFEGHVWDVMKGDDGRLYGRSREDGREGMLPDHIIAYTEQVVDREIKELKAGTKDADKALRQVREQLDRYDTETERKKADEIRKKIDEALEPKEKSVVGVEAYKVIGDSHRKAKKADAATSELELIGIADEFGKYEKGNDMHYFFTKSNDENKMELNPDGLYSRKNKDITKKLVDGVVELQKIARDVVGNDKLTKEDKQALVDSCVSVYGQMDSALYRGGKFSADDSFTASSTWSRLDRSDGLTSRTAKKYAKRLRELGTTAYDAYKAKQTSGKTFDWDEFFDGNA